MFLNICITNDFQVYSGCQLPKVLEIGINMLEKNCCPNFSLFTAKFYPKGLHMN